MRKFNAYETNQLINFGFDPHKIATTVDNDIPVEYITGKAEFRENIFKVNNNVLIPRVETEYLIELALNSVILAKKRFVNFADIGAGSGVIGLTFALELNRWNINFKATLGDISNEALKVVEENTNQFPDIKKSINIIKSDLFKNFPKDKSYDIIFANLPYIPTQRISRLDKSVKNYEPQLALDGGEDGLKYIRELLLEAKSYLSKDGVILLEVDDTHTNTSEFSKDWDIQVKNDFNGKTRFWVIKRKL